MECLVHFCFVFLETVGYFLALAFEVLALLYRPSELVLERVHLRALASQLAYLGILLGFEGFELLVVGVAQLAHFILQSIVFAL